MSTEEVAAPTLEKQQSSTPLSEDIDKDQVAVSSNTSLEPQSSDIASNSKPDGSESPGPSNSEQSEVQPVVSSINPTQGDWQAIWSPQHNVYYFYNMRTNETTWTNPLMGSEQSSLSATVDGRTTGSFSSYEYDLQAAAVAQGIDPSLAYLDPSLAAGSSTPAAFTYQAKFNARTGAFSKLDGRDPDHVSEYERMKRMSQFYFDVSQWEQEVAQRQEEEAENPKKRKKPTKKDLELFKERKRQKKIAKTAWLRT